MFQNTESIRLLNSIKVLIISLLLVIFLQPASAQVLKKYSATLSIGGPSRTINSGGKRCNVQQSTGQASVIESYRAEGYILRQGFIQPFIQLKPGIVQKGDIAAVFPNPFTERVYVNFSDTISEKIYVSIYDMYGKILFSHEFPPAQILDIGLYSLTPGIYILRVRSGVKYYNTKIIKE